jgi:hypothetical protein
MFLAGLLIGFLPAAEAAKMCVQVVDKVGNPVQGATVEVTHSGKKEAVTTDAKGECYINPTGATCDIEAIKGDCKERLAPVGILEDLKVIITLHCWPLK